MLRRFLTGKSIVIFDRGKLYKKNFSVAKIDINEFLTRMREKGYFSLDDVKLFFEPFKIKARFGKIFLENFSVRNNHGLGSGLVNNDF